MWAYIYISAQKPHILGVAVCKNTTLRSSNIHGLSNTAGGPAAAQLTVCSNHSYISSKGKLAAADTGHKITYNCIFYP